MARLILFNKPFGVLPQFTDRGSVSPRPTLSDFIDVRGIYPAGRLDRDSEGLLLITDDGRLQARIADPRFKLPKTYFVQVEGDVTEASLAALRRGSCLATARPGPPRSTASPPPPCGRATRRSASARPSPTAGSG